MKLGRKITSQSTGRKNLWVIDRINDPKILQWTSRNPELLSTRNTSTGRCVICKGSRMLCGKTRCPVMVRAHSLLRATPLIDTLNINGASPPGIFVGRIGYPYVYAGPLVPPIHENTEVYDLPELWFGKTIDEIANFRSMLIRGKHRVHVSRLDETNKIIDVTRELALSSTSTDVELALRKKPRGPLLLDDGIQPFGPSAPIKDLRVNSSRWDQRIEKLYYDTDLRAKPAVLQLYDKDVMVTKIQKALSVGALGIKSRRRLVPTRWSITAVDSTISKELMSRVKTFPLISEFRLYESSYLENQFEVLMMPDAWSYEAIEAWYPGTIWNPSGRNVVMYGDWEGYTGRTTYAAIGGCYYAARLAVCEQLMKDRRQATVIALREARPGYIMPVGVWQVRENVRNAMRSKPLKFNSLEAALQRIASQFYIPLAHWMTKSRLITTARAQRKMTHFF